MNPRLIALCSPAMASGKTTLANYLVDQHDFVRVAFATPIKAMVDAALTVSGYPRKVIERAVYGDLKEQPLYDIGPVTFHLVDRMLDALGDLPSEVPFSHYGVRMILWDWAIKYFHPGITSRRLQQTLGTEWGRDQIHQDLWMLIGRDRSLSYMAQGQSVVIDDLRFPNEYHAIEAAGGTCYRVVRPGQPVTVAHASEGQLDLIQMPEIWNTGSVTDLYAAADRALFA